MDANNNFEQNQALLAIANAINHEIGRDKLWGRITKSLFLIAFLVGVWKVSDIGGEPTMSAHNKAAHVALINVEGEISSESSANADDIVSSLRKAFESEHAKAILMRINSPGGSPTQANFVYDEVVRLKKKYPEKKVYAAITDVGASAAYLIASSADQIYADRASIVGSIGVLMVSYGFVDLMKKVGVDDRTIISGDHKTLYSPSMPVKESDKAHLEKLTAVCHQQFINSVKTGRGVRLSNDPQLFSGLFWTGEQALSLGLVDGLASPGSVVRDVIGVEDVQDYTIEPNLMEQLGMRLNAKVGMWLHANMKSQPKLVGLMG